MIYGRQANRSRGRQTDTRQIWTGRRSKTKEQMTAKQTDRYKQGTVDGGGDTQSEKMTDIQKEKRHETDRHSERQTKKLTGCCRRLVTLSEAEGQPDSDREGQASGREVVGRTAGDRPLPRRPPRVPGRRRRLVSLSPSWPLIF